MSVGFTVIGSCAASALKFINKVRLLSFMNTIFKSKIIIEFATCLNKNDFKLTKFQAFTNTFVQSLFGDARNIP